MKYLIFPVVAALLAAFVVEGVGTPQDAIAKVQYDSNQLYVSEYTMGNEGHELKGTQVYLVGGLWEKYRPVDLWGNFAITPINQGGK